MDAATIRLLLSDAGILGEKQKVSALLCEGSWGPLLPSQTTTSWNIAKFFSIFLSVLRVFSEVSSIGRLRVPKNSDCS